MRKIIGFVLFGLGAALLAVGVVTTTWAPGVVKKTPLDVNTTTYLTGTASRLGAEARPIRIKSLTRVDSAASDDTNAVWVATQCVVFTDEGEVPDCPSDETDDRILSIGDPDRFVTDRETTLAVSEEGYVDDQFVVAPHDGVVNKFPFDTAKKTYPYWDGLTERSWDADFVEEQQVDGLDTYLFTVEIVDAPAKVVPPTDTEGTYSNTINIWVEPRTGAIVRQTQDQQRVLDGETILELQADFTDEQVQTFVDDANDNIASLDLVLKTMPIVGFVGGVLFLVGGAAVILLGRRRRDDDVVATHREEPVPAGI